MDYRLEKLAPAGLATTGNLSAGSPLVSSVPSTVGLTLGSVVIGDGIPDGAIITALTIGAFSISAPAESTVVGAEILIASEPITLADAKRHCRVELDFTDDDVTIAGYIRAAREACELRSKKVFLNTRFEYRADRFPFCGGYYNRLVRQAGPGSPGFYPESSGNPIKLPKAPLASVESIAYIDQSNSLATIDPADYVVSRGEPGRVACAPGRLWPFTQFNAPDSVVIQFTAGYGTRPRDIPELTRHAIRFLTAHYYETREPVADGLSVKVADTLDSLLRLNGGGYR